MTCCTSEIRCVIPAEAGIQNEVPALIEKLRKEVLRVLDISEIPIMPLLTLLGGGCPAGAFSDADWQTAVAAAIRHHIAPQLYLAARDGDGVPPAPKWAADCLRQLYLKNTRRNMRLFHDLGNVLSALKHEGIAVIVLKGAHLGENIYRNIGGRELTDADLLFKEKDFRRASDFLRHHNLLIQPSGFLLDVHWNLDVSIADLRIDMEPVWARARAVRIGNVEVLALCNEDLLLHLCSHMAFHHQMRYAGLRALCDIREILAKFQKEIAWDSLFERADLIGMRNAMVLALYLAKELLNAPVPEMISERFMKEESAAEARRWAVEAIISEEEGNHELSPYFWEMFAAGAWYKKLPVLRKLLVPPREFIVQKYHPPSSLPHLVTRYVRRFYDRTRIYAGVLWRMLMRDRQVLVLLGKQRESRRMRGWMRLGLHSKSNPTERRNHIPTIES